MCLFYSKNIYVHHLHFNHLTHAGLFEPNHMQYEIDRTGDRAGEPTLAEMTEKAIQILDRGSQGYFLFVEG